MYKKIVYKLMALTLFSFALTSCGSDSSLGGNVTGFTTSNVTAQAETPRLEADLITGNTCTGGADTGGAFSTDTVDFTITAVKNTPTTSTLVLPISISGYTVTFTPKNSGNPVIGAINNPYNVSNITPTTPAVIPVAVITDKMKFDLASADPSFECSATYYQYDVQVNFHAVEVGSGESGKDLIARMVLAIADRQ